MQHVLVSLLRPNKFCYIFGKPLEIVAEKQHKIILGKISYKNMQFKNATKLEIRLFQSVQWFFFFKESSDIPVAVRVRFCSAKRQGTCEVGMGTQPNALVNTDTFKCSSVLSVCPGSINA